jgi:hypothetical protein
VIVLREDEQEWTLEEHLFMPDFDGRRGIDLLREHGVEFASRHSRAPADFGICKNGLPVPGVPPERCVLMPWEPPGVVSGLDEPALRARFLNYVTCNAPVGDAHHFTFPRAFNLVDRFFRMQRRNLVCLISRDRYALPGFEHQDLYETRRRIVAFFTSRLAPGEFDLFGQWPQQAHYRGELYFSNDLNGFGLSCPATEGQSLRLDGRYETLPSYHYNVCTENSVGRGYVTEKIWHAMASGCVPIYLGATDIDEMVPPDCYIDLRRTSLEEVLWIVQHQSQRERDEILKRTYAWLKNGGNYWFSSVRTAKKLLWAIGLGEQVR